jgi:RNA polymerase sigma-70 factor, ECF subfamily
MTPQDQLAAEFEAHRPRLKAVAYRMLGSLAEAEDAVQETWLRLARSDPDEIANVAAWLTTVSGRVCLDMLRARKGRREESLEMRMPDPVVSQEDASNPEHQALLADSVGLALQVVLDALTPAERLAFVLHDIFGLPFEQIAPVVDRTPVTAKKLASRARQRVREAAPTPDRDLASQRQAAHAFEAAAQDGDFDALLAILDPDVVLRVDGGAHTGGMKILRGAATVAGRARAFRRTAPAPIVAYPVLVNGVAGLINTVDGKLSSLMSFTVAGGKIVAIDILSDPDRLDALDLGRFTGVTFPRSPSS